MNNAQIAHSTYETHSYKTRERIGYYQYIGKVGTCPICKVKCTAEIITFDRSIKDEYRQDLVAFGCKCCKDVISLEDKIDELDIKNGLMFMSHNRDKMIYCLIESIFLYKRLLKSKSHEDIMQDSTDKSVLYTNMRNNIAYLHRRGFKKFKLDGLINEKVRLQMLKDCVRHIDRILSGGIKEVGTDVRIKEK